MTLRVLRDLALDAKLTVPARLVGSMTLCWLPDRNPAISTLARHLGMSRSTIVKAQRGLVEAGWSYEWAKGGPEKRERHRLVGWPAYTGSRYGIVGATMMDELHGQPTALLIHAIDSTGMLLTTPELAEFIGCHLSTAKRARKRLRDIHHERLER